MSPTRDLSDARVWMAQGTAVFLAAVDRLAPEDWARPCGLPGWTRSHLVAHVAANADAIGNLIAWAATGTPTPMYASATDRAEGIARGAQASPAELLDWVTRSAAELESAMAALPAEKWAHPVRTAQGRLVPAAEAPWMRSREVMVHAVDLGSGIGFADLRPDFLAALHVDIEGKRGGPVDVRGPLPEVVAYLAGRPSTGVTDAAGDPAGELPAWL